VPPKAFNGVGVLATFRILIIYGMVDLIVFISFLSLKNN